MPEPEFEVFARQKFLERVNKGQVLGDLDSFVSEQMSNDYSERLEDVMNCESLVHKFPEGVLSQLATQPLLFRNRLGAGQL